MRCTFDEFESTKNKAKDFRYRKCKRDSPELYLKKEEQVSIVFLEKYLKVSGVFYNFFFGKSICNVHHIIFSPHEGGN
jgi:formyltetrahydrofolate hydrolase